MVLRLTTKSRSFNTAIINNEFALEFSSFGDKAYMFELSYYACQQASHLWLGHTRYVVVFGKAITFLCDCMTV